MLRVGLTGGLGSGKSTVGAMLRALGAHVIDADAIGRDMMQPGQPVYARIVAQFGPQVVRPDGQLDRAALARQAFECGRVEELNAIVHPAVIAAQADWAQEIAAREPDAVAIVESALVFETKHGGETKHGEETKHGGEAKHGEPASTGLRKRFDRIILVTAPDEVKIRRFVERMSGGKPLSDDERASLEKDAKRRLAAQLPDSEKVGLSDYVIENAGTLDATQAAVLEVYRQLRIEAEASAAQAG